MDLEADSDELPPTQPVDMEAVTRLWHRTLGDDLETCPSDVSYRAGRPAPPEPAPLAEDARFTRIALLGRGGMGEVHRALQAGLEREVALKVLLPRRAGMRHARESFLAEAVITGQLEHPNIVPVYALQCLPGGEISLAMKLVGGRSWKAALASEHEAAPGGLAHEQLEAQLETLSQVCNAVAFAHSRSIVHLDLKPENIMLGAFGEVLVLDWGLAASFAHPRGGRLPHVDDLHQPCGTPAYMPPELALGEGPAVGPRSDVYLLGAILYEILCGHAPHGGNLIAALRRALLGRPVELEAWVPAELAALCQRAMERDPARRFQSVQEFQAALKDYLLHRESHQIVEAADRLLQRCRAPGAVPTSQLYADFSEAVAGFKQAQKLWPANPRAQRGQEAAHAAFGEAALAHGDLALAGSQLSCLPEHGHRELRSAWSRAQARQSASRRTQRVLQTALTVAVLAIVLGLSVGLVWIYRQKAEIVTQAAVIEDERDDARARGEIAFEALAALTHEVREELLVELADARSHEAGRRLLRRVRQSLERLLETHVSRQRVSRGTILVLVRIAELEAEIDGSPENALQTWQEARSIARELRKQEALEPELCGVLLDTWLLGADLFVRQNQLRKADVLLSQALNLVQTGPPGWDARSGETSTRLGLSRLRLLQGQLAEAREHAEAGLRLARVPARDAQRARAAEELLGMALGQLVRVCEHSGDVRAASDAGVELLAHERARLGRDPTSPNAQDGLCRALLSVAHTREILGEAGGPALRREALALRRQLYLRAPDSYRRGADLSTALLANSEDALQHGDTGLALQLSGEAVELCRGLLARDPSHATARTYLTDALRLQGDASCAAGSFADAARWYQERLSLTRETAAIEPDHVEGQQDLARALHDVGHALKLQGRFAEAAEVHQEALVLQRRLADLSPGLDAADRDLLVALARFGDMLQMLGRLPEARAIAEECLERSRALFDAEPGSAEARRDLSIAFESLASVLAAEGALHEARSLLDEALQLRREASARDPANVQALDDLRLALLGIGDVAHAQGALQEAEELYRESLALARQLVAAQPDNLRLGRELAASLDRVGDLRLLADDRTSARALFGEAMELTEALLGRSPDEWSLRRDLAMALMNLGLLSLNAGEGTQALQTFRKMLRQSQQLHDEQPENLMLRRDLATALACMGDAQLGLGELDGALENHQQSRRIFESLVDAAPDDLGPRHDLALSTRKLAAALEAAQVWQEAATLYQELVGILQQTIARDPDDLSSQQVLTMTWYNLSRMAEISGELREAADFLQQAVAHHSGLIEAVPSAESEVAALQRERTRVLLQLRQDLVEGSSAPESLEEHWLLAEGCRQQRDWQRAVEVLEAAFALGEQIDNPNRLLFAARIASLAGAEDAEAAERYRQLGLEWLAVFLDTYVAAVDDTRARDLDPTALLEAWRFLRDTDPELGWLRTREGFAALFAEQP